MGGQTALNLARELAQAGVLEELGVELIGAPLDVIQRAEDRELFRDAVRSVGLHVPSSRIVTIARRAGAACRCPRSSARRSRSAVTAAASSTTARQLHRRSSSGCAESPIGQVLVEESVRGWDEFELEVVRDRNDNVVIVCSIENIDPMGVHTGDSVTVAPQMTLSDHAYQELRDAAIAVIRAVGVECGGSNIQFARERDTRRAARDRDEPARLALVGARVEGDGLSDREGRGEARRRLHARRDPERPDRHDARELRADARLRRRQVPALRIREVPRRRHDARHADEVGRRGDGHRPHVRRGVPQGASARASSTAASVGSSPTRRIRGSTRSSRRELG